jgi:hypothetical protein
MSRIIYAFILFALFGIIISTTCENKQTCPGTTTCCLSPQGSVGCCPYEKATCCSDGLHCCPNGFTCDLAGGRCAQGNNSFLAFVSLNESTPAVITPAESTVKAASTTTGFFDIIKCLKKVPSIAKDLFNFIKEKKKNTDEGRANAAEIANNLKQNAIATGIDCVMKIIG